MSTRTGVPVQGRIAWRDTITLLRSERKHAQILGGSVIMLFGTGVVSAMNFGYNVAVARMLGPAAFGHAAAAVTLLMLVSAITLAFQLVCAKFVARNDTSGARSAVYSTLMRRAWYVGLAIGSLLMIASDSVATYLHLPSGSLVSLLALGITFYIPLGVKRGGLQGICQFRRLTANFVLEALVRFAGAIVLIEAGLGVTGAIGAIALSVVLAYFLPLTPAELQCPATAGLPASLSEGMQAIVFFVGQVVINNIDILLVKHFFDSNLAGLYAAIALVGRVLYFFSWSVVSAMFPVSAGAKAQEETRSVLVVPLSIVLVISVAFTVALGAFPEIVLRTVFGSSFQPVGHGFDSLLMLYAAATGIYSLAVVLMAYEMSRKLANTGWIQLVFSMCIFAGITAFHSTLREVVVVQLVLMVALLIIAAFPFFRSTQRAVAYSPALAGGAPALVAPPTLIAASSTVQTFPGIRASSVQHSTMRRVRRVAEVEVIAEFLKNEFHHAEFRRDRDRFERWVMNPDTTNEAQNALRRALLFRRRESMWRELPPDTEWWEVQLSESDLRRLRVFPRAQWRKIASGNFRLSDIVERIRAGKFSGGIRTAAFIGKLEELSARLRRHGDTSAILLIGIDEHHPLTIIEGNHRMTAASMGSTALALRSFRFLCGFSPHMTDCCWYQTNLTTLWRYARNRMKILLYDREAEIAHLVRHHDPPVDHTSYNDDPPGPRLVVGNKEKDEISRRVL